MIEQKLTRPNERTSGNGPIALGLHFRRLRRAVPECERWMRTTVMKATLLARSILAAAIVLALQSAPGLLAAQTNASIFSELPYASTLNREVDFMRSLLEETNRDFDQKVYALVGTNGSAPIVISYSLVSFVFYYPAGIVHAPSATEMVQPDQLICTKGIVKRRDAKDEIPANYVRMSDMQRKEVGAELDLVLSVAPLDKPGETKCLRGSFRFVYRNGWKEE